MAADLLAALGEDNVVRTQAQDLTVSLAEHLFRFAQGSVISGLRHPISARIVHPVMQTYLESSLQIST